MKRYIKLLVVFVVTFLLTGCIKMEVTMDIHKDKSMELGFIYAIDDSLMEQSTSTNSFDESTKNLKENGFQVTGYKKDGKTGMQATKEFKNIDDISSDEDVVFDMNKLTEEKNAKAGFKVKKGLFKNHYYAKVQINSDTSSLTNNRQFRGTDTSDADYSSMMQGMDMTFNVNLPFKAIKSNATSKENNEKTLKWDLTKVNEDITFEFALYNYRNIYIVGGITLFIILLVITSIINKPNKPTIDKRLNNVNITKESHEDNSKVIVDDNEKDVLSNDDPIVDLNNMGDGSMDESSDTFSNPNGPNLIDNKPSGSTENSDALNDLYNN